VTSGSLGSPPRLMPPMFPPAPMLAEWVNSSLIGRFALSAYVVIILPGDKERG